MHLDESCTLLHISGSAEPEACCSAALPSDGAWASIWHVPTSPAADEEWIDLDLRELELGYGEKAGLQIYRNYTRSFEDHAIKRFRESIESEELNLDNLLKVATLLTREDIRFTPVIACGYADELLEAAFKAMLPEGVPGGRAALFSGYGPLSDLSKRIRLAYAFDVLSPDLMRDLDRVRAVRNRISHDWDMKPAFDLLQNSGLAELYPIEGDLGSRAQDFPELEKQVSTDAAFRIRLIWLLGRLTYEAAAYHRAKQARLSPHRALYESGGTAWLRKVAGVCMDATRSAVSDS
jgi:hypothetical protein